MGPPALPDLESEGGEANGEECDHAEEEKQEEEEESPCGETRTDEACCCGIEELNLTIQAEQENERIIEEDEQEDQKTTQGILYSNIF